MNKIQIDNLTEDNDFFTQIFPDVWLMDNHKWAFYIWNKFSTESGMQKLTLVHADYHWDDINDYHASPEDEATLLSCDDTKLIEILREDNFIRYDSFICPAIIRGLVNEVHFYCKQYEQDGFGVDEQLLERFGVTQYIHDEIASLASVKFTKPFVMDLCLDLFNKSNDSYTGDLWSDDEIHTFLTQIKHLITDAELVTISLSFGCSGTEDDTRHLAKLVLPIIESWRK